MNVSLGNVEVHVMIKRKKQLFSLKGMGFCLVTSDTTLISRWKADVHTHPFPSSCWTCRQQMDVKVGKHLDVVYSNAASKALCFSG